MPRGLRAALTWAWLGLSLGACANSQQHTILGPSGAEPLVSWTFQDLEGRPQKLESLRGQVVLVDFWATWCVPCLESMPTYNEWHQALASRGFVVVAISLDEDAAAIPGFVSLHAPDVQVWHDVGGKGAMALNIPTMPTAFLLDRSGRVVLRHEGFRPGDAAELRRQIDQLLAE